MFEKSNVHRDKIQQITYLQSYSLMVTGTKLSKFCLFCIILTVVFFQMVGSSAYSEKGEMFDITIMTLFAI